LVTPHCWRRTISVRSRAHRAPFKPKKRQLTYTGAKTSGSPRADLLASPIRGMNFLIVVSA
jgi:hypothetical protein